jgi:hypothetical protein
MTIFLIIIVLLFLATPMNLRGQIFHNFLVNQTKNIFMDQGFIVHTEYRLPAEKGRSDFVDILAYRERTVLLVEVETSVRHVLDNAAKAQQVNLPLWIIVPNRKVRLGVVKTLKFHPYRPGGLAIQIPVISELFQRLMKCFPNFPAANSEGKTGKQ